ncbi:putative Palmitoyltransferase Zdhhc11B [Manis pentadactyla]|nr:putative Palmitoyltransferase Zdhhc11B [Manis pentadactyla]
MAQGVSWMKRAVIPPATLLFLCFPSFPGVGPPMWVFRLHLGNLHMGLLHFKQVLGLCWSGPLAGSCLRLGSWQTGAPPARPVGYMPPRAVCSCATTVATQELQMGHPGSRSGWGSWPCHLTCPEHFSNSIASASVGLLGLVVILLHIFTQFFVDPEKLCTDSCYEAERSPRSSGPRLGARVRAPPPPCTQRTPGLHSHQPPA